MSLYVINRVKFIARPFCNIGPYNNVNFKLVPANKSVKYLSTERKGRGDWTEWRNVVTRFIPVGLCLIAVMQWRLYRKISKDEKTAKPWQINCYCALPLRAVSRSWGWIADKQLPEPMRPFIYNLYVNTFGVDLSEAHNEDLKSYASLAEFFTRALKDGVRKIDSQSCLVSPCDGKVLHFGTVHTSEVEQVKGVTYSLEKFLGENTWNKKPETPCDYRTSLLHKPNHPSTLHQCVIYLAPGDYHRFHSPTEWQPTHRRHFSGQLLSVNPKIAKWVPGLFCINERAVYLGTWKHGFFSLAAVGATNVGGIKVYFDKCLQTNHPKLMYQSKDKCLGSTIGLKRGDPFGEFRMGSTIVLVFEAPANFHFSIKVGQKVYMGQSLGSAQVTYADKAQEEKGHTS